MKRIFIIAGEASGDALGASLMRGLKEECPDVVFAGVGGREMQAEGLQSLFPMEDLSVMGIFEVLPVLGRILKRIRQAARAAVEFKPDALVTIDSPDFCFRVVKKVKKKGAKFPCIHYVAPSVWAWRPGRAAKVAKFLDHLLTLLPFEPPYFEEHGLKSTFVGHPVVERQMQCDSVRFREKYGIRPSRPVLCLLPGSRMSELDRLLGIFEDAMQTVLHKVPQAVIVVPTLPHLKKHIETFFRGKGINPVVIDDRQDKIDCFAASTGAIAASGTVSLELALCDTPHVIAYKVSPLTAWMARRLIKTPYVNLVNIILKRAVVPELLLDDCEAKTISAASLRLLENKDARAMQLTAFREALIALGLGDPETPGQKAARAVLGVIGFEPPVTPETPANTDASAPSLRAG